MVVYISLGSGLTAIYSVSFLAIVPLAKVSIPCLTDKHVAHIILQLLAFATEEISIRTNQTIAGLLNATLGNAFVILRLICEHD
jgi:Ca2+/H+ antiporter